jgi:hypothetical protein
MENKPDMVHDGSYGFHDPRWAAAPPPGCRYIGNAREWWPMLVAFERFRRIELLDNAEALYLLCDVMVHEQDRLPIVCTKHMLRDGIPEVGIFLDASLLRSLADGCRELLLMAGSDRCGAFRGSLCDGWPSKYGQEPLLGDDEDRAVRRLGKKIIGLADDDAVWRHSSKLPTYLPSDERPDVGQGS